MAQVVKNLSAVQETWVRSLGWENPLEKGKAIHSSVQRIISDSEAAKLLTKHLAFENANSTCQAILRPVRRSGSLIDYMKQCADVGPSMLQGVAIA